MIILIGLGCSLFVFFVLFWVFSSTPSKRDGAPIPVAALAALSPSKTSLAFTISSKDIEPIAGEDVLRTQLDLARAYLETDRKNLAKSILHNVIEQGSFEQKQEANRLLANLHRIS